MCAVKEHSNTTAPFMLGQTNMESIRLIATWGIVSGPEQRLKRSGKVDLYHFVFITILHGTINIAIGFSVPDGVFPAHYTVAMSSKSLTVYSGNLGEEWRPAREPGRCGTSASSQTCVVLGSRDIRLPSSKGGEPLCISLHFIVHPV